MKLFFLHDVAIPGISANTVNVAKMCSAFAGAGHVVTLICPPGREAISKGRDLCDYYGLENIFTPVRIPCPRFRGGKRLFRTIGTLLARLSGADILYARKPSLLLSGLGTGLQLILEAHTSWEEMGRRDRAAFLRLTQAGNFGRLVCISQALADEFRAKFPALHSRTMVAHDGADEAVSSAGETRSSRETSRALIGYAGHLYAGKGMELIAELAALCPWADFIVIGGTDDAIRYWKNYLVSLPNVRFVGFVSHKEVPVYLQDCEIVLAPYQRQVTVSDGNTDVARWMSPLKIFEYMSQAKAIVSSDLPVLREVLAHEVNALLAPPDDASAWVLQITRLVESPALRRSLGERAKSDFVRTYTWAKRATNILAGLRGSAATTPNKPNLS